MDNTPAPEIKKKIVCSCNKTFSQSITKKLIINMNNNEPIIIVVSN
jgi:hypothetical protein